MRNLLRGGLMVIAMAAVAALFAPATAPWLQGPSHS